MRKSFLGFSFLFLSYFGFGQRPDSLPPNPQGYLLAIEPFILMGKQPQVEAQFKEVSSLLNSTHFSPEEFTQIKDFTQLLLELKVPVVPFFYDYFQGLISVKKSEDGSNRFKQWHHILNQLLNSIENRNFKDLTTFLAFSPPFFENQILSEGSAGAFWQAGTDQSVLEWRNGQPAIQYQNSNLSAFRKESSITILNTNGIFYPLTKIWEGFSGRVTWERLNMDPNIFAELKNFSISLNQTEFSADSVKMFYPQYFGNKGLPGKLTERLAVSSQEYPLFESYDKDLSIRDIGERINYKGGVKIAGNSIQASGKSTISYFKNNGAKGFICSSENFKIKSGEYIVGNQVNVNIYLGEDSIYHPSVDFRFDILENKITIKKGDLSSEASPFYSSYHKVQINTGDIVVFPEKDSLILGTKALPIQRKDEFVLESEQHFRKLDYDRLQAMTSYHPLPLLIAAYRQLDSKFIDADYYARLINTKFNVENIKTLLFQLVKEGFIRFDIQKNEIEVLQKTFHYSLSATNQIDFDPIKLRSTIDDNNAIISSGSPNMTIYGVKQFEWSAKNRVAGISSDEKFVLGKNRNMDFKGRLFSGLSVFTGESFHFDYDKFQITIDTAQFLDLYYQDGETDDKGFPIGLPIESRIEKVSGNLLIDAPQNKSAKENIPFFPSLNTFDTAYVFYERALDSVYLKDSFYFELLPFSLNKLKYIQSSDLRFPGYLHSFDIFPVLQDTLSLMEDFSLGFIKKSPDAGWLTYQKRGNFLGDIHLSNAGLLGSGRLNYLMASIDASDFVFTPKQMTASAEQFNLEEFRTGKPQVPKVNGEDVSILWRPYGDSLSITPKTLPFKIFADQKHQLEGLLVLTPEELKGSGILDWDRGTMISEDFSFQPNGATTDTTSIDIKISSGNIAISSKNMQGEVNFDNQLGLFKSNDSLLITELPSNGFATSLNNYEWQMKDETIKFLNEEGQSGKFISTIPEQDGLNFLGKSALYNLITNELKVEGVESIISADAFIIPDSGKIDIAEGGIINRLTNAKIIADTITQYHLITDAEVEILGKKSFKASGNYEFKGQSIFLEEIIGERYGKGSFSEKPVVTRASAEIFEGQDFYLDSKIKYYGQIFLESENPNLIFDGYALLESEKFPADNWFSFKGLFDKNNPILTLQNARTKEGEPVRAGFYLSRQSANFYTALASPLESVRDRPIFEVNDALYFDANKNSFVFGDTSRIIQKSKLGNILTFNETDNSILADGVFKLGNGMEYVKISAAGTGATMLPPPQNMISTEGILDQPKQEFILDIMTGIDFPLPENLKRIFVEDIIASFDAGIIVYLTNPDFYKNAANQIFPPDPLVLESIEAISTGYMEIPEKSNPYLFLFSRLNLKWNEEYQSFITTSKTSGLASIGGKPFNKMLETTVELIMPGNEDDRLYIYIKTPEDTYYFFGYRQGILNFVSNSMKFMDEFRSMKVVDTILKMPDGETFELQEVDEVTATRFLRRIQNVNGKK